MNWRLAKHGVGVEQQAWSAFLRDEWPEYEDFWRLWVVPMTGRPDHTELVSDDELAKRGRRPWHVLVHQLHYTALVHLIRVHEIRRAGDLERDAFIEGVVRLSAATDNAFEILERVLHGDRERQSTREGAGQTLRRCWAARAGEPLEPIRTYRNALVHGRVLLERRSEGRLEFATFETYKAATDWRDRDGAAFEPGADLLGTAWATVLPYLRRQWSTALLPRAREILGEPPHATTPTRAPSPQTGALPTGGGRTAQVQTGSNTYLGGSATYEAGPSEP